MTPDARTLRAAEKGWMPDGRGLPKEATGIIAGRDMPIHLRLTSPDGRSARGACGQGLGEWWTGRAAEVNCPACLEVVHA